MGENAKLNKGKKITALILMMFSLNTIYLLPYLMYTYYTPLQDAMGLLGQDAAYGKLLNVYGIANVILYIPGGWLADKYDAKKLLVISMISTGVLGIWEGMFPSYGTLLIIFVLYAVTTVLTYWSASIKVINLISDPEEQGSMYGTLEAGRGIIGILITTAFVFIYAALASQSNAAAMKWICWITGFIMIAVGLAIWLLFPNTAREGTVNKSLIDSFKAVGVAFKIPITYLLAGMIFAACLCQASISYYGPYLENICGMSSKFVVFFANYNRTICTLIAASIAAFLSRKIGNSAKIIVFAAIGDALAYLILLIVPGSASVVALVLLLFIIATLFYAVLRALYYACIDEIGTHKNVVGSVIGIASILGFCPDMFYTTLAGSWLEADPVGGYNKIFMACIAASLLGVICAGITIKMVAKKQAAKE